jgi:hypothetical protein
MRSEGDLMKKGKKWKGLRVDGMPPVPERLDITLPTRVLTRLSMKYPGMWGTMERSKSAHDLKDLRPRETWCYCTRQFAHSVLAATILEPEMQYEMPGNHSFQSRWNAAWATCMADSLGAAALAAWRMTKGVYTFHPALMKELLTSEIDEHLPVDAFTRMPDWCVYIPTPGLEWMFGLRMHGFFAWVDCGGVGEEERSPTLQFEVVIDPGRTDPKNLLQMGLRIPSVASALLVAGLCEENGDPVEAVRKVMALEFLTVSIDVPLDEDGVIESIHKHLDSFDTAAVASDVLSKLDPGDPRSDGLAITSMIAVRDAHKIGDRAERQKTAEILAEPLIRMANLVLYLCADNRDLEVEGVAFGRTNVEQRLEKGRRAFEARQHTEWKVGYRVGSALEKARKESEEQRTASVDGRGISPLPHVRRAHYHTFLTGPKDDVRGKRVKWLPPIPVMFDSPEQIVVTQHQVRRP